jgi:hypothetical protein
VAATEPAAEKTPVMNSEELATVDTAATNGAALEHGT